jgi:hypothetical protein
MFDIFYAYSNVNQNKLVMYFLSLPVPEFQLHVIRVRGGHFFENPRPVIYYSVIHMIIFS